MPTFIATRKLPPAASPQTSFLQINSVNGLRIAEIVVPFPLQIANELLDQNIQGVEYQVHTQTQTPSRNYDQTTFNRQEVNARLAALSAPDLLAGVKLFARSIAISPADPSILVLTFQHGN